MLMNNGGVARATRLAEVRWAALALVAFALAVGAQWFGAPAAVTFVLYLVCYTAGGWKPAVSGVRALGEKRLDVDLLMVFAAIGAAAIGQTFDGGLLIVIFAISGALESVMTVRTEESVRALLDFAPERAVRETDTGEEPIDAAELVVGDTVVVRPGERIPADAAIVAGASEVDQSTLTGESLPLRRSGGDRVLAGTLNGTGVLHLWVLVPAAESVLARVAEQVEQAGRVKARRQLWVERIEQRYSVGMVAATVALFAIPLAFGAELEPSLLRAMTFMIVASPCAVVLATMPPLLATIANAGRHGVLVKDARTLEAMAAVDAVALDKTGTLTRGEPVVREVEPLGVHSADEVLAWAAAVESGSEHPIGRATRAAARARGVAVPGAESFRAEPGRGVHGVVQGHSITVADAGDRAEPELAERLDRWHRAGCTAVAVLVDEQPAGVLALTDELRPDASNAVRRLTEVTGDHPVLLTGDRPEPAGAVAGATGIEDVRSGLLPPDKTAAVTGWSEQGRSVLCVGDGVNDAPALAAAAVGVAVAGQADTATGGSALSLRAADAVVVRDELSAIPTLMRLSRRARRVATANLVFAAAVITVLSVWDLVGTLPLPLGVAGHELSTVLVGLNGLRLLAGRCWPETPSALRGAAAPEPTRPMPQP